MLLARSRERPRADESPVGGFGRLVEPMPVRTGVTFFGMVGLFTDDVYTVVSQQTY